MVIALLMILVALTTLSAASNAAVAAPTASAVGLLATHTNQPSLQQESVSVSPGAAGEVLTLAIETKFPGVPSFTAASVTGGGVGSWTKASSYLTVDRAHGQELWWGVVRTAGPSMITATYTAGATSGKPESATSMDVQEFASSAGSSTIWSFDSAGAVDTGVPAGSLRYPTLTPTAAPEVYFGYMAVVGSVLPGSTPGVVYQADARFNQVVYNTSVSSTLTPTSSSASQTYSSIGMLLRASAAAPSADTTPPSAPTGLAVTGTPIGSRVSFGWVASADKPGGSGVAGYRVYRGGSALPLSRTLVNGTSFTDTSVRPGLSYSYRVTAVDRAGNQSAPSAPLTISTPAAGKHHAPDPADRHGGHHDPERHGGNAQQGNQQD